MAPLGSGRVTESQRSYSRVLGLVLVIGGLGALLFLGAEIVLYDRPGGEDRDEVAGRLVAERGATLVHAYADPWVIEGQGSAAIEIVNPNSRIRASQF